VLQPGTDVKRLEDATRAVFDKVWGLNMSQLANMPLEEMTEVAREFSDLLLSMPFQMPQDFIYLSRAVGILSGMCTGLDPQFDPWQEMQPFTEQLLDQNSNRLRSSPGRSVPGSPTTRAALGMAGTLLQDFARRVYKLPALTDNVLSRADRGELEVKMMPGDGLQRQINRIEVATGQIALGVVFATITLASTILYVNQEHGLGIVGYVMAAIVLMMIWARGRG
jgi:predicted unusual protein kinase regulating ubiquinone biosynthesis (AarF/ABC1/UbiB family)